MPLATQLDESFDDDDDLASSDDGEDFSRVPLIPDTRFSSKFTSENAEDWSEAEENTQELREQWEKDQRKMKSIFTNGEHQQPAINGASDDVEVDDLSPTQDKMTEDVRLSREDSRKKTVELPGRRISGPVADATNRRPVTDRRRRELSYDEEDDDDVRYRRTTTTTTTTTTRDTTKRMTKSEDDVELRRPRARSSEGNLIS